MAWPQLAQSGSHKIENISAYVFKEMEKARFPQKHPMTEEELKITGMFAFSFSVLKTPHVLIVNL